MAFERVDPVPVSEQVYRQLLDAIIAGDIKDKLPSERDLAATFEVNRHAVREAMKRLQQANLVEINQGGATRVLDPRERGRLDLMPDLMVHRGKVDPSVMQAILEMRLCIGADAARLCAERNPSVAKTLADLAQQCHGAARAQLIATNRKYWTVLVEGSNNIAYRLALNTLIAGLDAIADSPGGDELIGALLDEYRRVDEMTALAEAIGASDSDKAAALAAHLLRPAAG